jgi:hypothetical protein
MPRFPGTWPILATLATVVFTLTGCGLSSSSSHFSAVDQTDAATSGASQPILGFRNASCLLIKPSGVHLQFDIVNQGAAVSGLEYWAVRHDPGGDVIVQDSIVDSIPSGTAETFHVYDTAGSPGSSYTVEIDPRHAIAQGPGSQDVLQLTAPPASAAG